MIVTFNVYNTQYKCTLIRFQLFYKMMLTEQKHWKLKAETESFTEDITLWVPVT